jgi:hypothetical protein
MDRNSLLITTRTKNYSSIKRKLISILASFLFLAEFHQCLPPCNSFPKIFGGNSGHSYLRQVDVYGDRIALGGDTNDVTLTGETSYIPYIAVMSVTDGAYFYWAKAIPGKPAQTIAGI